MMEGQYPADPVMIHPMVITHPDHMRKLSIRKRMGQSPSDDLLLHIHGKDLLDGGLSSPMRQLATIQQTQETLLGEVVNIPPQPPVGNSRFLALFLEGAAVSQDRLDQLIAP